MLINRGGSSATESKGLSGLWKIKFSPSADLIQRRVVASKKGFYLVCGIVTIYVCNRGTMV